jgi:hypothetical protein
MVGPLVWLLVFVFIVAVVHFGLKALGVTFHPQLERLMIGLVILIVVVVVVYWLLGILGWSPGAILEGPFKR